MSKIVKIVKNMRRGVAFSKKGRNALENYSVFRTLSENPAVFGELPKKTQEIIKPLQIKGKEKKEHEINLINNTRVRSIQIKNELEKEQEEVHKPEIEKRNLQSFYKDISNNFSLTNELNNKRKIEELTDELNKVEKSLEEANDNCKKNQDHLAQLSLEYSHLQSEKLQTEEKNGQIINSLDRKFFDLVQEKNILEFLLFSKTNQITRLTNDKENLEKINDDLNKK
jgi:hypothetical protein